MFNLNFNSFNFINLLFAVIAEFLQIAQPPIRLVERFGRKHKHDFGIQTSVDVCFFNQSGIIGFQSFQIAFQTYFFLIQLANLLVEFTNFSTNIFNQRFSFIDIFGNNAEFI